jgi:hypothetical protein
VRASSGVSELGAHGWEANDKVKGALGWMREGSRRIGWVGCGWSWREKF